MSRAPEAVGVLEGECDERDCGLEGGEQEGRRIEGGQRAGKERFSAGAANLAAGTKVWGWIFKHCKRRTFCSRH